MSDQTKYVPPCPPPPQPPKEICAPECGKVIIESGPVTININCCCCDNNFTKKNK